MSTAETLAERGNRMRRKVHGDERIDAMGAVDPALIAVFEQLADNGYGAVWSRTEELSLKVRCLVTAAIISTLGADTEFRAHVRGSLRAGWTKQEILEALAHTVLYAGAPRGQHAMYVALEVFAAYDAELATG
ncbi:MAG TPA: carboxymuconolactone decarboxylase family protein [Solirubrobacteraceae bacterium]|nr:carboxymuconolactone decarboxylase family protein [Solirubrobacteraceae bacterium]